VEGVEDEGSGDSQQDVLASVNIATEAINCNVDMVVFVVTYSD